MHADKQEVINNIIHDLKSPLAAITGLSEVFLRMLSSNLNDNQRDVIRKISGHARFALDLIEDLLDVERIASGQVVLSKAEVNIRTFLEDIVQAHSIAGAEKNIRIDLEVLNDSRVYTDIRRLKEILNNLVSNALKYSEMETVTVVSTSTEGEWCVISVKDQGVGIKTEEIEMLFKPFSQLSNHPTGNEKSTGLGLSIVKNLVELLGGTINVESVQGKGTTFILRLPCKESNI